MKTVFLSSFLAMAAVIVLNQDAAAQVSIRIGGTVGGRGPVILAPTPPPPAPPPGQAKKWHGVKSAKHFAPGQVKKQGWKKRRGPAPGREYGYDIYREEPAVYPVPARPEIVIGAHIDL